MAQCSGASTSFIGQDRRRRSGAIAVPYVVLKLSRLAAADKLYNTVIKLHLSGSCSTAIARQRNYLNISCIIKPNDKHSFIQLAYCCTLTRSGESNTISGVTHAIAPLIPLLTVLAAAVGWYAAALFNGNQARRTERSKQEHARQGTLRQVQTLLRASIATLEPFFSIDQLLPLDDLERIIQV
jgi:hypothetical protein